jgi:hypothetical protein
MRRPSHIGRCVAAGTLLLVACGDPLIGHKNTDPGYQGPTGPIRPVETQLRGRTLDFATQQPIAGVRVAIDTSSVLSGADGSYVLQHLRMSAANLEATKDGYEATSVLIPLDGGDKQFDVRLRAVAPPAP